MYYNIRIFKGLKKMDTPGKLVDSPTHRFSNTNISGNSKPKRFMQKLRKNWFIAMSL